MRVQISEEKQIETCSICNATGKWVETVCVNGIEGLYCTKCDTLTLALPGWSVSGVMALYSKIKKKERYIL